MFRAPLLPKPFPKLLPPATKLVGRAQLLLLLLVASPPHWWLAAAQCSSSSLPVCGSELTNPTYKFSASPELTETRNGLFDKEGCKVLVDTSSAACPAGLKCANVDLTADCCFNGGDSYKGLEVGAKNAMRQAHHITETWTYTCRDSNTSPPLDFEAWSRSSEGSCSRLKVSSSSVNSTVLDRNLDGNRFFTVYHKLWLEGVTLKRGGSNTCGSNSPLGEDGSGSAIHVAAVGQVTLVDVIFDGNDCGGATITFEHDSDNRLGCYCKDHYEWCEYGGRVSCLGSHVTQVLLSGVLFRNNQMNRAADSRFVLSNVMLTEGLYFCCAETNDVTKCSPKKTVKKENADGSPANPPWDPVCASYKEEDGNEGNIPLYAGSDGSSSTPKSNVRVILANTYFIDGESDSSITTFPQGQIFEDQNKPKPSFDLTFLKECKSETDGSESETGNTNFEKQWRWTPLTYGSKRIDLWWTGHTCTTVEIDLCAQLGRTTCAWNELAGKQSRFTCSGCEAGQYAPNAYTRCFDCPKDTYTAENGNTTSCTPCPGGKSTDGSGKTKVSDCTVTGCSLGKVASGPTADPTSSCTQCELGKYMDERTTVITSCKSCLEGRVIHVQSITNQGKKDGDGCEFCSAGRSFVSKTKECSTCGKGQYQPANNVASAACTKCPAGKFLPDDGKAPILHEKDTDCYPCGEGSFSDAGAQFCAPCSPGKTSSQNSEGKTICTDCQVGTYNPESSGSEYVISSVVFSLFLHIFSRPDETVFSLSHTALSLFFFFY